MVCSEQSSQELQGPFRSLLSRFPDEEFLETKFRPCTRWCFCSAVQCLPGTATTSSNIKYSLSGKPYYWLVWLLFRQANAQWRLSVCAAPKHPFSFDVSRMLRISSTDIVFLALVNQAAKQTLSMVYNDRSGISKCRISIVSKCHNPSIRYVEWKEVFEPESIRLVVCPGVLRVSVQVMNRDNTG